MRSQLICKERNINSIPDLNVVSRPGLVALGFSIRAMLISNTFIVDLVQRLVYQTK